MDPDTVQFTVNDFCLMIGQREVEKYQLHCKINLLKKENDELRQERDDANYCNNGSSSEIQKKADAPI